MKRITFYIDGFNFYFGLKRMKKVTPTWRKAYWIDMVKFCKQFLSPDQQLEKVIYFTATPWDSKKSSRQSAFLNANKAINGDKFEIVRGKYFNKNMICPFCKNTYMHPEEKRTDVNITVRMIADSVNNLTDILVLVSGDSDLLPPIEYIQNAHPEKRIRVYFPPSSHSADLANNIKHHNGKVVHLQNNFPKFQASLMEEIVCTTEAKYEIPTKWKTS
ncbi:MAG: NYN domain-containing protein [Bacteroides sp.]|nr:NYN domain-containing protein [Bacteroides sp.]